MNLENEIAFVKSQIIAQEKMTLKYESQPSRAELHALTKSRFESLLRKLEGIAASDVSRPNSEREIHENRLAGIHLTLDDIEDASPELLAELNLSESDRQEMVIADVIAKLGGIASLAKIIVMFHKRTGEVLKRATMVSKLFRMADKSMIFNVSGKRGIYSTYEMSDEEVAKIFGRPGGEPLEDDQQFDGEKEPLPKPTPNVRASRATAAFRSSTSISTPTMGDTLGALPIRRGFPNS